MIVATFHGHGGGAETERVGSERWLHLVDGFVPRWERPNHRPLPARLADVVTGLTSAGYLARLCW